MCVFASTSFKSAMGGYTNAILFVRFWLCLGHEVSRKRQIPSSCFDETLKGRVPV